MFLYGVVSCVLFGFAFAFECALVLTCMRACSVCAL